MQVKTNLFGRAALVVALLFSQACSNAEPEDKTENTAQSLMPINVETEILQASPFTKSLRLVGEVRSDALATLTSQTGGTIESILADRGAKVQEGDTLLTLDARRFRAALQIAQAQESTAALGFEAAKSLWEAGQSISETDYKRARYGLQIAQAATTVAKADLADCFVKAPFDGTVTERYLNRGELLLPGQPLLQIVSMENLKVRCGVPETQALQIKQGMQAEVIVPEANIRVNTKVSWLGSILLKRDRALPLEVKLPKQAQGLAPGMACQVVIENSSGTNSIHIPMHIVQQSESAHFVFLNEEGFAERRMLTLGDRNEDRVLVLEGLAVGDELITAGYRDLVDGHPLNLVKQD
jgi:membrane fusion protein, multidrug efflux system